MKTRHCDMAILHPGEYSNIIVMLFRTLKIMFTRMLHIIYNSRNDMDILNYEDFCITNKLHNDNCFSIIEPGT